MTGKRLSPEELEELNWRLPHVDPGADGIIQEDDPEVLAAYARNLWLQWAALKMQLAAAAATAAAANAAEAAEKAAAANERNAAKRAAQAATAARIKAEASANAFQQAADEVRRAAATTGVSWKLVERYRLVIVKAATAWLVSAYHDAEVPIPYVLVQLLRALIEPDPEASSVPGHVSKRTARWAAILFEAANPEASAYAIGKLLVEHGLLGTGSGRGTASEIDSAESTVKSWRKDPSYEANVRVYRRAPLAFLGEKLAVLFHLSGAA